MNKYLDYEKVERAKKSFIYKLKSYELEPPELTTEQFIDLFSQTQAEKVLWHLQHFRTITSDQCKMYGISYCSSAIRDLENKLRADRSDYYIYRNRVSSTNWLNKKLNYTEYTLEELI